MLLLFTRTDVVWDIGYLGLSRGHHTLVIVNKTSPPPSPHTSSSSTTIPTYLPGT